VQTFRYRGERHACLPGQLHLLHPDEPHDGAPADTRGLRYRIVYLAPEVLRDASPTGRLPFVPDPVHQPRGAAAGLAAALRTLLVNIDDPIDDLAAAGAATTIADGLHRLTGRQVSRPTTLDLPALRIVADHLASRREATSAARLEVLSGLDRYALVRQFKAAYGTTPDRFRVWRQLDRARTAIRQGLPLATVAAEAGFADQSHLTRHFKRAYGLTPGQWRALTSGDRAARDHRRDGPEQATHR
jgi:AraC-like DNA-binding protein